MGSGHSHAHAPLSATGRHRWRLAVAFVLIAAFFVVELVSGFVTGSLALLSDAGHMAADVVTLGAALVATRIAARPDRTGRRTYGSFRAEVFASGLAVLVMIGVSVYIAIEAVGRAGTPTPIATGPMMVVGALGLVVNLIAMVLLRPGAAESLTLKGAHYEVIADTIGSVGVIVAGALVAATGATGWDTAIALAIAVFVLVRAVALGREVLAVLGQHAPPDVEPRELTAALCGVAGVASVHDLHVWRLTSGMDVATAHLVLTESGEQHAVLDAASDVRHLARHLAGRAGGPQRVRRGHLVSRPELTDYISDWDHGFTRATTLTCFDSAPGSRVRPADPRRRREHLAATDPQLVCAASGRSSTMERRGPAGVTVPRASPASWARPVRLSRLRSRPWT